MSEPFRAAYMITSADLEGNQGVMVIETGTAAKYFEWQEEMEDLKERAKGINASQEHADPPEPTSLWRAWLHVCHDFRQKWGDALVPPDIRAAINVTRRTLNLPPLEFGPVPPMYRPESPSPPNENANANQSTST